MCFQIAYGLTRVTSITSEKTTSSGMQTGSNRKDELFNDILDRFKEEGISFEKDAANSEGVYFTQVVANVSLVYYKSPFNI